MMTLKELKALSYEELEKKYDEIAKDTQPGLDFYRDEIARRDFEKIQKEMLKRTKIMGRLTLGIFLLTVLNVIFVGITIMPFLKKLLARL